MKILNASKNFFYDQIVLSFAIVKKFSQSENLTKIRNVLIKSHLQVKTIIAIDNRSYELTRPANCKRVVNTNRIDIVKFTT